jgi:hypothetical protein
MRQIAMSIRESGQTRDLIWFDYGCGKGGFIEEIRPPYLFTTISGYDSAVDAFASRPERRFDLVIVSTCWTWLKPRFLVMC